MSSDVHPTGANGAGEKGNPAGLAVGCAPRQHSAHCGGYCGVPRWIAQSGLRFPPDPDSDLICIGPGPSLLVLPSLLLLITPSRKGAERGDMIDLVTRGEYEYEPHSREQAFQDRGAGE